MDSSTAGILGSLIGAFIAGPAGYLFERLLSRPRVSIQYAETAFEDVISVPVEIQQQIKRVQGFIEFVKSQVRWDFPQRLEGNLFSREELRVVYDLGVHYLTIHNEIVGRLMSYQTELASDDKESIEHLAAELLVDYKQMYETNVEHDMAVDAPGTKSKLLAMLAVMRRNFGLAGQWLTTFLTEVDRLLKFERGTSNRLIVRVGLGNRGLQDGIIRTEARLLFASKTFRLPIDVSSRPWVASSVTTPSVHQTLPARSFQVLEFLVDERLNAVADVEMLRKQLSRGTSLEVRALGVDETTLCAFRFTGSLP